MQPASKTRLLREHLPRRITPLFDRICAKILFPEDLEACFGWSGAKSTKRRGQRRPIIREAGTGSRVLSVARWICEMYQGPPPSRAHEAGHTCPGSEREDCVNPRHLRWMTRVENEQWKHSYDDCLHP